jgi:hypothetical protein
LSIVALNHFNAVKAPRVSRDGEISRGRDDAYVAERVEGEKVAIARDDESSVAIDSELEEFVVSGVAAFMDRLNDRDRIGDAVQEAQKVLTVLNGDVRVEFRPRKDLDKFLEDWLGEEDLCVADGLAHSAARNEVWKEKPADEGIGIEDNALPRHVLELSPCD